MAVMTAVSGLHHITCIARDPRRNLDFYRGLLGLRLVKKTVNQDAPETYHLFYADAQGSPGTDLTLFPWPGMPDGRRGTGLADEVLLAIPQGGRSVLARIRSVASGRGAAVSGAGGGPGSHG